MPACSRHAAVKVTECANDAFRGSTGVWGGIDACDGLRDQQAEIPQEGEEVLGRIPMLIVMNEDAAGGAADLNASTDVEFQAMFDGLGDDVLISTSGNSQPHAARGVACHANLPGE